MLKKWLTPEIDSCSSRAPVLQKSRGLPNERLHSLPLRCQAHWEVAHGEIASGTSNGSRPRKTVVMFERILGEPVFYAFHRKLIKSLEILSKSSDSPKVKPLSGHCAALAAVDSAA